MKVWAKYSNKLLLLLAVFLAASVAIRADGLDATATYTNMQVSPGVFQYDLTLNNTGTTTIGTFWFSWIPGAGFMGVSPTNVMSPAGWTDTLTNTGASIQWLTAAPIAPGTSGQRIHLRQHHDSGAIHGNVCGARAWYWRSHHHIHNIYRRTV